MKATIITTAVTLAAAITPLGISQSAGAAAAVVNRGACISTLGKTQSDLLHYQQPGQIKTGPLTINENQFIMPTAFEGAAGCTR